jgi:hypothetical protein
MAPAAVPKRGGSKAYDVKIAGTFLKRALIGFQSVFWKPVCSSTSAPSKIDLVVGPPETPLVDICIFLKWQVNQ